jgi:hypothetical protein
MNTNASLYISKYPPDTYLLILSQALQGLRFGQTARIVVYIHENSQKFDPDQNGVNYRSHIPQSPAPTQPLLQFLGSVHL